MYCLQVREYTKYVRDFMQVKGAAAAQQGVAQPDNGYFTTDARTQAITWVQGCRANLKCFEWNLYE